MTGLSMVADSDSVCLPARFLQVAAQRGPEVAVRWKHLGLWQEWTWTQWADDAQATGCALLAAGLQRGDRVAVMASTRPECLSIEMGAMGVGVLALSLFPDQEADGVIHALRQSSARILFVGDQDQLRSAIGLLQQVHTLEHIVYLDGRGLHAFKHPQVQSFASFCQSGVQVPKDRWAAEVQAAPPDAPALWVLTSATTGPSKPVLISHRSLLTQLQRLQLAVPGREGDRQLSLLPLGLVLERCLVVYRAVLTRCVIHLGEGMPSARENLREVTPQVVLGVPWLWAKLHAVVQQALDRSTPMGRLGYRWTLALGQQEQDLRQQGKSMPAALRWAHGLLKRSVLRRIRDLIGLRDARCVVSTGAPVAPELAGWYRALGLDFVDIYGPAEASGFGALLGRPAELDGLSVRLGVTGEIQLRGHHVAIGPGSEDGSALDADGWWATGDLGVRLPDGALGFAGRMADRLTLSGGHAVMPGEMEARLRQSPYVADALVLGEGRRRLGCLILIDHDQVAAFARKQNIAYSNFASLTRLPQVRQLLQQVVDELNRDLDEVRQLGAMALIPDELTVGDGRLSPVLQLKRGAVLQRHAALIDRLDVDGG
ncbi:MAG: long-chain fatty acid--CoA ligase [Rhodoferax sp.]|nr:long-chain fatty acid--CoA ligase [Rhodoferax sp.]